MSAIGETQSSFDNYGRDKDYAGVSNNPAYGAANNVGNNAATVESATTNKDVSTVNPQAATSPNSPAAGSEPVGFNETFAANSRVASVDAAKLQNAVPVQTSQAPNTSVQDAKIFDGKAYDGRLGDKVTLSNGTQAEITDVRDDPKTGFRAAVFSDTSGNKTIAYAGTEMTSSGDWGNNIKQAFGGVPGQYQQGLALANEYQGAYGDKVSLTGHSLGGGIASYASINTDLPAVGVNSAPLGRGTYTAEQRANPASTDQITQYAAEGEILTDLAANPVASQWMGNTIPGERISVPAAYKEMPSDEYTALDDFYNLGVSIKNHFLGNTAP